MLEEGLLTLVKVQALLLETQLSSWKILSLSQGLEVPNLTGLEPDLSQGISPIFSNSTHKVFFSPGTIVG